MSKKRMMSKQQRLYYESANKERVRQELAEYVKQIHEMEQFKIQLQSNKNNWT
jgi:hypothetical protein